MSRNISSEKPSIIEGYDILLHNQISTFADSFGPVDHFVECKDMAVSRLPPIEDEQTGFRFVSGRSYGEYERIFFFLDSSKEFGQAGSERISPWPLQWPPQVRYRSRERPIDPKMAFVEIKETYRILIEGGF